MAKDKIILCFHDSMISNSNDYKRCRVALNPLGKFVKIEQSTHEHRWAKIVATDCEYSSLQRKIKSIHTVIMSYIQLDGFNITVVTPNKAIFGHFRRSMVK